MPLCKFCGLQVYSQGLGRHQMVCGKGVPLETIPPIISRGDTARCDSNIEPDDDPNDYGDNDTLELLADERTRLLEHFKTGNPHLSKELAANNSNSYHAHVEWAALRATSWREENFATDALVFKIKEDFLEYDAQLRKSIAAAVAEQFGLDLECVQKATQQPVNPFKELGRKKHETTVADELIGTLYPKVRVLGKRTVHGRIIEDCIAEFPVCMCTVLRPLL